MADASRPLTSAIRGTGYLAPKHYRGQLQLRGHRASLNDRVQSLTHKWTRPLSASLWSKSISSKGSCRPIQLSIQPVGSQPYQVKETPALNLALIQWEEAMATAWRLSGDYFENCNCSVVCPCLISPNPQLTSKPTQGVCDVPLAFHIETGNYGDVRLDGLNVVVAVHTPGPMSEGNWTAAAYIDDRANDKQTEALGAIFTGAAGSSPITSGLKKFRSNIGSTAISAP